MDNQYYQPHPQQQQQQAFPNVPLSLPDIETHHHQQESLLYSAIAQSAPSQTYFDDGLEALLLEDLGRPRAFSSDFSVSPIVEGPSRFSVKSHGLGLGQPLPPAPPLWRSPPLAGSVPAPVTMFKSERTKKFDDDLDKKPAYKIAPSSGALLAQAHLHYGDFSVKY
ncbi:hypothetical protein FisN_18Hh290 [Fistulifera solaris]|uniref:Uncharacterized protein n=1 Tax=Fistulifera solaris TaxID=1519565 RepID=A0A1Z5KIP1_FISSO|nr:hypothetical protein FisN_18Hh290 [Fistulifera solaris]|eukprot:GAX26173.1 hypothetical protein FisN_18Hh290 [Fistulifera solaris]